jgi:hypothetical protein
MSSYLVIDENGFCVNAIAYDGVSPYDPGEGLSIVPWDEMVRPWVGWRLVDGQWHGPPQEPEVQ